MAFNCKKCGADVMVTGFTQSAVVTTTYMKFREGVTGIAVAQVGSDVAHCACCGAKLQQTAAELRAA